MNDTTAIICVIIGAENLANGLSNMFSIYSEPSFGYNMIVYEPVKAKISKILSKDGLSCSNHSQVNLDKSGDTIENTDIIILAGRCGVEFAFNEDGEAGKLNLS